MVSKTIFNYRPKLGKGSYSAYMVIIIGPDAIDCNREEINTTLRRTKGY